MPGPSVTVVIPVFNVRPYLEQCVESVLTQSYDDVEIVLVDDGSTDGSGDLCDVLAGRHHGVRAVHQANAGLSAARNTGIDAATGSLVTFLDSDDWWDPSFLEALVGALASHPRAGVAMSTFQRVPGTAWAAPWDATSVLDVEEAVASFAGDQHTLFTIACAKLYRRDVLHEVRFPVGRLHEDEFTTYRALMSAPTVVVPEPLYFYRHRADGIVSSPMTPERLRDAIDAAEQQASDFLAAGHHRAAAWSADQAFRKRVRLITLLRAGGHTAESDQEETSLSAAAHTGHGLPRPLALRVLRRVARHSPRLAVRAFVAAAGARGVRRRAVALRRAART